MQHTADVERVGGGERVHEAERVAVGGRRAAHYGAVILSARRPRQRRARRAEVARAASPHAAERAARAAPRRRAPGRGGRRRSGARPVGGACARLPFGERERRRRVATGGHAEQRCVAAFCEGRVTWHRAQRRTPGWRCTH